MTIDAIPAATYEPLDADEYKRQAALLKSLHCCRPVLYEGKERFIQVMHARQAGGRIEGEVRLTGGPESVDLKLIEFPPAKQ